MASGVEASTAVGGEGRRSEAVFEGRELDAEKLGNIAHAVAAHLADGRMVEGRHGAGALGVL